VKCPGSLREDGGHVAQAEPEDGALTPGPVCLARVLVVAPVVTWQSGAGQGMNHSSLAGGARGGVRCHGFPEGNGILGGAAIIDNSAFSDVSLYVPRHLRSDETYVVLPVRSTCHVEN
jgi:hypothetical protein